MALIDRKKIKKFLTREVNILVNENPTGKVGQRLHKKRRVFLAKYVSDSFTELKKVTWPGRRESLKLTLSVVIFTAVFTVFMIGADSVIGYAVERILL